MIRWLSYLVLALVGEIVAFLTCWLWPAFASSRTGPVDNNNFIGFEHRLPLCLSWLDTPDNSLLGDAAHKLRHAHSSRYWQMTCWLARNRCYGLKWSVLAAPVDIEHLAYRGDPLINRNNGRRGAFRADMGIYWEYKLVRKYWGDRGVMLDFGWLLNAYCSNPNLARNQPKALFQFSPRIVKIV